MYKIPLALCIFFHMIEWFRQTIFVTTAMVNVNLIKVYYILSFNVFFGLIVMLIAFSMGFAASDDCALKQPKRTLYLKLQIVAFFVYLPFSWLHVLYFKVKGVAWCHEIWLKDEDADDE